MARQNLVFDPSSKQWVPGETPRTMGVPFEGPVNHPLEVRVAALEQGGGGGEGGSAPAEKGFPYGAQWWMGYTIEDGHILIHNIILHYNRGVVASLADPISFYVGAGVTRILGFSLDFSTGAFMSKSEVGLAAFAQTGDGGDGKFYFPVYQFLGTKMVVDYVHGSNLGGL